MPRARNIKPGFFENEFLGKLPGDIQLLFIGLWTLADREGVVELRLGKIRKAIFGFRSDIDDQKINGYITVIERLDNGSMLVRARYDKCDYIIVTNFEYHQKPHHTEKKGKLPTRKTLMEANNQDLTVTTPLDNGYVTNNPHRVFPLNTDLLNTEDGRLNTDLLISASPQKKPEKKSPKITLDDLSIDHVKDWLVQKRNESKYLHVNESEVLEIFKDYCLSKGKRYENYVAAYRSAFSWERFNKPNTTEQSKSKHQRAREALGLPPHQPRGPATIDVTPADMLRHPGNLREGAGAVSEPSKIFHPGSGKISHWRD